MDQENRYHYQLIARAIALIDTADAALSLEALSAQLGLSPAHFQRLFSQWAGVSPKTYQSYLKLGFAKTLLNNHEARLQHVAQDLGLSGSARLHDLFVKWESMTPGEYASGGPATLFTGFFETPYGPVAAVGSQRGLCGLSFALEIGPEAALEDLTRRWPGAQYLHAPEHLEAWVTAAFTAKGEARMLLLGGPFQIKVWEALLQIPEGTVSTYGAIAEAIGHPQAVRAVGTAVGRNPLAHLIPCHRVLRKDGALGGYHWGLGLKRQILAREALRMELL